MFKIQTTRFNFLKFLLILVWVLFVGFIFSLILIIRWYNINTIRPLDSQKTSQQVFTVAKGSSWDAIADKLASENLIRDAQALKWYVRLNNVENVHAGSFELSPSLSTREIVDILTSVVEANVKVTIYPEHNLTEIQSSLVQQGFSRQAAQAALDISNYQDHYLVREIIPSGPYASLEGYIMPETFAVNQFNAESAQDIIRQALDGFHKNLTPALRADLQRNFNSIHEAVILASIVELEAAPLYRPQVAQVFLHRLRTDNRLDSDVTFVYVAKVEAKQPDVNDPSLYNTRLHYGLPPGPISNVSRASLLAVAQPAATDYFYFLVGDDGQMYFNRTYEEHVTDIELYCQVNCQPPSLGS